MESLKTNSTKRYILGALILTVSMVIIGVSLSYAYFVNSVEEVNPGNQGVNVTSGELTMNFTTSQTLTATAAGLINDANILTEADFTAFSVTLPSSAKVSNAQYNLYLTDIKMTNNFKSNYLKWALYSADTQIASGDFSGVTLSNAVDGVYDASDIVLLNSVDITNGTTTSYKLYVWLSYDANTQQNSLLQGSLSTKVAFRAVSK